MTVAERPVNLHQVDGDPRKMAAVRRLVRKYPDVIAYWHNSGIDERVPVGGSEFGVEKHKHGVLGHQFGGAMVAEAIGDLLIENGVLNEAQADKTVRANLVHDADKPTDMALITMAMGGKDETGEVSWAKVEAIGRNTDLPNIEEVLAELKTEYEEYFDKSKDVGERVHVARAFVAGRIHKERLAQAGFSPDIIDIQGSTEYTGCDEVDLLLDMYDQLPIARQKRVIQKCVICYVDNGMKESEIVPVEERTEAVFKKPINVALSTAYRGWNDKGETAEEKQNRVGRRIEAFLAELVRVEPDKFLNVVEQRIQQNILQISQTSQN